VEKYLACDGEKQSLKIKEMYCWRRFGGFTGILSVEIEDSCVMSG